MSSQADGPAQAMIAQSINTAHSFQARIHELQHKIEANHLEIDAELHSNHVELLQEPKKHNDFVHREFTTPETILEINTTEVMKLKFPSFTW